MAAGNGSSREATMKDEFSDRHQAIGLHLAGQPVEHLPGRGSGFIAGGAATRPWVRE